MHAVCTKRYFDGSAVMDLFPRYLLSIEIVLRGNDNLIGDNLKDSKDS